MPLLTCPNCNVSMTSLKRFDIEMDTCPQCRGVWLDRGELEKVLDYERANAPDAAGAGQGPYPPAGGPQGGYPPGSLPPGKPGADQYGRDPYDDPRRYDQRRPWGGRQEYDDDDDDRDRYRQGQQRRRPSIFDIFD
jgi:Zn-finger nucleic acid-binding protein